MSTYAIDLSDITSFVKGVEDVKQSWGIILSTIPGTVPLNPTFGSDLFKYIDRPISESFSSMANTIIKDLEKWETRATITKVTRKISGSNIIIYIYGKYTGTDTTVITDITVTSNSSGGIGTMIIGSTFIIG